MSADNWICTACILEPYLQAEIRKSESIEKCDYCGLTRPAVTIRTLAERCDVVIENFFECSSTTMAVVHFDRAPEGGSLLDVLKGLLNSPHEDAHADVAKVLTGELWFDRDTQEHRYGDDDEPWFIERTREPHHLDWSWQTMEKSLKNEARMLNPKAAALLESVFGDVGSDRTRSGGAVIVEIGPGCRIDVVYRARTFQSLQSLEEALRHPQRTIGSPPPGVGRAGRMNASGVSVFYGSTTGEIAIPEIRPPVGSHVVVGRFRVIRKLRLLDLDALGEVIPQSGGSLFDPKTFAIASRCEFLKTLTTRMTMPVMPEHEIEGYLITQATADFLATHPKLNLDGIIYPSAQTDRSSAAPAGRNVVLFHGAAAVQGAESARAGTTGVKLWEIDDDQSCFDPEIWTQAEPPDDVRLPLWHPGERLPSLDLDCTALEILQIRGVEYSKETYLVRHRVVAPKVP